jgi:hypothetical protein
MNAPKLIAKYTKEKKKLQEIDVTSQVLMKKSAFN